MVEWGEIMVWARHTLQQLEGCFLQLLQFLTLGMGLGKCPFGIVSGFRDNDHVISRQISSWFQRKSQYQFRRCSITIVGYTTSTSNNRGARPNALLSLVIRGEKLDVYNYGQTNSTVWELMKDGQYMMASTYHIHICDPHQFWKWSRKRRPPS